MRVQCAECGSWIPNSTESGKALCSACRHPKIGWYGNPREIGEEINGNGDAPVVIARLFGRADKEVSEPTFIERYKTKPSYERGIR
jgi:hypothetical protein